MSVPKVEVQGLNVPRIPPPVIENFRPLPVVQPLNYQLAPPIVNTGMPALGPAPRKPMAPPEGVPALRAVTNSVKNDKTSVIGSPAAPPKSQPVKMEAAGPLPRVRPAAPPVRVPPKEDSPPPPPIKQATLPEEGPKANDKEIDGYQFTVAGRPVELPTPGKVVELSLTAFIITIATLLTISAVKKTQKVLSLQIALIMRKKRKEEGEGEEEGKKKKKIKAKPIKPLIHFVRNRQGLADVLRYTQDEVEILAEDVEPEAYLRKQIDEDGLYEALNQIVIDVTLKGAFTKEGLERFKYFIEPRKFIKKLRAKLSLLG